VIARICSAVECSNTQPCPTHSRRPFARSTKYAGGRAWQRTRERIFARDGYVCQLRLIRCTGAAEVVDHKLNRARGGSDDDSNLQTACRPCNDQKRRAEAIEGRRMRMGGAG